MPDPTPARQDYGYAADGVLIWYSGGFHRKRSSALIRRDSLRRRGPSHLDRVYGHQRHPGASDGAQASGTYIVNPDCSGTTVVNTPNSPFCCFSISSSSNAANRCIRCSTRAPSPPSSPRSSDGCDCDHFTEPANQCGRPTGTRDRASDRRRGGSRTSGVSARRSARRAAGRPLPASETRMWRRPARRG